ncbi:caspase-8-like [Biomphalaria glabrata]|uniref:Caspase-8 n=1 Tax=Biomphalaria glabrata TaxID=6526 RepID=A0A9U8EMF3_BIOGL|nr:caspase-8-like [Biomphalaria glabrata]XP_013094742.2 caspase-8-like [Biomphalaria glabrata]XP_013094743.2 caspase-8-like [Biomphalaria glabrata]XP_013094744.2 caspase-8-like [Biomphalaria glabrata]
MSYFRDGQYRETLALIDSEMHEDDIKNLKFLSEPFIPKKLQKKFTSALELFEALEKSHQLSENKVEVLVELLHIIGRVDLAMKLLEDAHLLGHHVAHGKYVNPFYVLLFKLSEELNIQELQSLSFLYGKVPKRETIVFGIDLFSIMLQHVNLSPTKLNDLESYLANINRNDLVQEIRDFKGAHEYNIVYGDKNKDYECTIEETISSPVLNYNSNDTNATHHSDASVITSEEEFEVRPVPESQSSQSNQSHESQESQQSYRKEFLVYEDERREVGMENNLALSLNLKHFTQDPSSGPLSVNDILFEEELEDVTEYYRMKARPRGICLIIDNQRFTIDETDLEATHLGNRMGSEKDCEALKYTFEEKLHFQVDIRQNLKDFEIAAAVRDVSSLDHSQYDCFVCCILTHGGEGFVFGSNGRKYSIKEIINCFSAQKCPTLAGKPKLFFLQACRGKRHQAATVVEMDAPEMIPADEDLLPPEADFLLGYATVADAVSYRSRSTGTFYISELTKALNTLADKYDLLRILTRVNYEVSRLVYSEGQGEQRIVYKQIPAPQYTLRKVVKFL